jgi:methionyl-tRNA synthetase
MYPRIDIQKLEAKQTTESNSYDQVNVITFKDFQKVEMRTAKVISAERVKGAKVEMRTAKVISAERVKGADRLLLIKIEVGKEQRQIVAGIAEYYSPEDIAGKMIVIVANLKPVTIRGLESNGMLLAASKGKNLALITLESNQISSGIRIF